MNAVEFLFALFAVFGSTVGWFIWVNFVYRLDSYSENEDTRFEKNEETIDNEKFDDENDGPTLVFDDFDQSADYDVPAYIRKQNR